jgi:hypothetical protein
MYYVEINNNKITGKAQISINIELQENQFEVTEEIYNALVRMPADYETDEEGNIISVVCPPEPDPPIVTDPIDEEKAAMAEVIIDMENRISQLEAMLNA